MVYNLLLLLLVIIFGSLAYAGISAAPWLPLWKKDVRRMLQLAQVQPGETVYDLGAGDARILIAAAQVFKAKAVGFECSLLPYFMGYINIILHGVTARVSLKYRNFFNQNLSHADVICTFLTPKAMEKLKSKLLDEAKPGCRIVSYAFALPGLEATTIDKPAEKITAIYLYQR